MLHLSPSAAFFCKPDRFFSGRKIRVLRRYSSSGCKIRTLHRQVFSGGKSVPCAAILSQAVKSVPASPGFLKRKIRALRRYSSFTVRIDSAL
jgi:hypothetical protein